MHPSLFLTKPVADMAHGEGTSGASQDDFARLLGAMETMQSQMASMKRELTQERAEANEQLVKKLKMDKKPNFKKKAHEKQFEFNEEVKDKLGEASAGLNADPPAIEKVKKALKEGEVLINQRQKLIKIADRSENGWATVDEYMADELADNSDDEKRLFKAESRAGRKLKDTKAKRGKKPLRKIFTGWQARAAYAPPPVSSTLTTAAGQSPQASRPSQPQVLGPCFQCWKLGHFCRSCPLLNQNPK